MTELRAERARMIAALIRRFGPEHLERIEDAAHEAIARALERWPRDGAPADPTAWLVRVAHNLVIDGLRRGLREVSREARDHDGAAPAAGVDDELALTFLCCHPELPRAAQLALTLQVACGLTAAQIARSFLADEKTIAQRIVRAKQRLRDRRARFEVPAQDELPARLAPILEVVYLVFGEGYDRGPGDPAADELCAEALRLARVLAGAPHTATPAACALHALCCFQASRAPARRADDGSLLLIAEQDRARWDGALIEEGFAALARAGQGRALSRYHLEAGIAACHAAAPRHDATDWPQVVALYDALRALAPSPVVEVNRAVAVAMARGAAAGLDELDAIPERELVARYPYALAAYAELYASLGQLELARAHLESALAHQPSPAQRALLQRKLAGLAHPG